MQEKTDDFILRMEGISKSFLGVKALHDVSLHIRAGEVHALMGENGAGKSTLMNILTGILRKDAGHIYLDGQIAEISTPKAALESGISMIYQELNPVLNMTVSENIFLGKEPCYGRTGIVNKKKQRALTLSLFKEAGIYINPDARVRDLSIAEIQMIEMVKAVSYRSRVIIMDEPTSAITQKEVTKLFEIIRKLRAKGVAIIYISHKMDEIFEIADRITVLRDGRNVDCRRADELDNDSLIKLMVGRDISELFPKLSANIGGSALEVDGFGRKGVFNNISFDVRKGEIVGFAGLLGAGRTEIMETIFGINKPDEGRLMIDGKEASINSPAAAVRHRMALITEDRKLSGLNLKGSVKANVMISSLATCCRAGQFIDTKKENTIVDAQINSLRIKASGRNQVVGTLSGGNQQKVVLSKWFLTDPDILILDEPTRGIDIGAKQEIYKIINQLAQQGKAILLVSSEMPELLGLCDRIIVLHKGKITGVFQRNAFDSERIMNAAMNNTMA